MPSHPLRRTNIVNYISMRIHNGRTLWGALTLSSRYLDKQMKAMNTSMFLVVDELDEVYRSDQGHDIALDTLGELQGLGNSVEGRVSVILCGSSAQASLPAMRMTRSATSLRF